MSLELFTAGKLLEMALSPIVGNAASEGTKQLWQMIKNRLLQNQPVIEAEIREVEQNPTQGNFKLLEFSLQDEMDQDNSFVKEISKLAKEIADQNRGDTINQKKFKAEDNSVVAGKISNSRVGGSDTNLTLGKN